MNLLLVEDDDNKAQRLIEFVGKLCPGKPISIAKSYISGLDLLVTACFDVVLLDMALPNYEIAVDEEGGQPMPYGGRDLIRQIQRQRINTRAIVITQYEKFGTGTDERSLTELDAEMAVKYPSVYVGLVYYHAAMEDWKDMLAHLIAKAGVGISDVD